MVPPPAPTGGLLPPPEEMCADNPLLAKCKPLAGPLPAPSVPAEPSTSPLLDDASLSPMERAEAVLDARCGSCHGEANPLSCGICDGMYNIGDMGKMISTGTIVPCNWRSSRIYQRIARGEMPPASANLPPPTQQELAIVASFVNGLCDDLSAGGPVASGQAAIESWLANDCGSCHGNTPADARVPLVDVSEMVAEGLIVPCSPDGSSLVQRLRDDSMPPLGVSPRPTASELRDLEAFIERPCSAR
jgi:hypothetical protein